MHRIRLVRALAAAAFISLALAPCAAPAQEYGSRNGRVDHWVRFAPEGEDFSIRMPSPPKVKTRAINPGKGKPQLTARDYVSLAPGSSRRPNGEVRYLVTSVKLPGAAPKDGGSVIKRDEFDKLMHSLQQSFEQELQQISPNIALGSPREVVSGIHMGDEYAIEVGGVKEGQVRFFATATHVYLVAYVPYSFLGTSYLDSFELKADDRLVVR